MYTVPFPSQALSSEGEGKEEEERMEQEASGEKKEDSVKKTLVDLGANFIHGCFDWNPVFRIAKSLRIDVDTTAGGCIPYFLSLPLDCFDSVSLFEFS